MKLKMFAYSQIHFKDFNKVIFFLLVGEKHLTSFPPAISYCGGPPVSPGVSCHENSIQEADFFCFVFGDVNVSLIIVHAWQVVRPTTPASPKKMFLMPKITPNQHLFPFIWKSRINLCLGNSWKHSSLKGIGQCVMLAYSKCTVQSRSNVEYSLQ